MANKKLKALVTGGAGFLGSHLCDKLLAQGLSVYCVDNLLTGSKKNISHLISNRNFEFIKSDIINNPKNITGLKPDYIFHLASPASPIDYWQYPEETLLVNSQGTLNMLRLAIKTNSKILFASTSEVYGDPMVHPQKETYFGNVNSFGPRSCYDEGKRFAEAAIYVYINKYRVKASIIRIFNTYGPRMQKDDGRVVTNFIEQALNDKAITIDGDGSQTRSFCYVSDLIEGIYKVMFSELTDGEVVNLGNPVEFTIRQLAETVIRLTNSNSSLTFSQKFRQDDPMRRKPDIGKAIKMLGWKPKVELEQGLEKTIEYFNKG